MSSPGHSLVQRVAERLRSGPTHTLELAREVLRLRGHAGAASAAVFTLLGADERFRVDAGGVWRLVEAPPGTALHRLRFAVVDVETTGGAPTRGDRITEIAIVQVEDGTVRDEFVTLVNPGRSIPRMVGALTGITRRMVASAPYFEHVAPRVVEYLEGRVFVAHNAPFDRRFVRHELIEALGEAPPMPTLCTVQLARGLLPRLRHRNLDALAHHFDVRIEHRHRAFGDARATALILLHLLDEAATQGAHDLENLRRLVRRGARRAGGWVSSRRPPPLAPEEP